jgi:DNA-binding response OmpR family regulator
MRRSISGIPCQILTTDTCRGASHLLHRGRISIVICESNLPDGTWRDMMNCVGTSSEKPILIVTSRCADEYLWAEVLNLGGFDVVAKPFNMEELRHVLETVCLGLAPQVERN